MTSEDEAVREASRSVWGASPAGVIWAPGEEPATEAFFQRALGLRRKHDSPWFDELIPIATTAGQRVLEVGSGVGFDALAFLQAGADYTGVDLTPANVDRAKAHLRPYGLVPNIQVADAEHLPFRDEAFDVYYSYGVLHHVASIERALAEAYRVIRPGGHIWILVYNRNSIFYWLSTVLVGFVLKGGFRRRTLAQQRSLVELTTSAEEPLVNVYTGRQVARLIATAGFARSETFIRKLEVEDLPLVGRLAGLYQRMPQRILDWLGNRWGWYVIARARR